MIVITFDYATFIQQFPVFANTKQYTQAQLTMHFDMATNYISDIVCGRLDINARTLALNLMTAHLTYLSNIVSAGETTGLMQSATVDKVNVSLTPPPVPNQWQWWLNQSPYGQQLLSLLQARSVGGFYVGGTPQTAAFRNTGGGFTYGY